MAIRGFPGGIIKANQPKWAGLMFHRIQFYTLAIAAFAAILAGPVDVQARTWNWAKSFPINQYTPQDIEILKSRMVEILDHEKDGTVGEWINPETGHGGSITPMNTRDEDGRRCRLTRFRNFAEDAENLSEHFLCKQPDGIWAVEMPASQ